jgi:hypothetical protein
MVETAYIRKFWGGPRLFFRLCGLTLRNVSVNTDSNDRNACPIGIARQDNFGDSAIYIL